MTILLEITRWTYMDFDIKLIKREEIKRFLLQEEAYFIQVSHVTIIFRSDLWDLFLPF